MGMQPILSGLIHPGGPSPRSGPGYRQCKQTITDVSGVRYFCGAYCTFTVLVHLRSKFTFLSFVFF